MVDQAQVGETSSPDGSIVSLRAGRLGDTIASELNGRFYEITRTKRAYSAVLTATTTGVAAGNITGAAAAASTQFALWNPTGSGVNLALVKLFVGPISGTMPAGPMFHNSFNASAVSATSTAGVNNLIGFGGSIGRVLASAAGSTLTGGGILTAFRPSNASFTAAAYASASGSTIALENINGDIVIPPGMGWVPCWSASGTSLLNAYGVVWHEIPV